MRKAHADLPVEGLYREYRRINIRPNRAVLQLSNESRNVMTRVLHVHTSLAQNGKIRNGCSEQKANRLVVEDG